MSGEQSLPSALVRGIEQLEPMPVTAQRLVALMQGADVSLAKIAELVEFDQAIAASVLRMARSWAYGDFARVCLQTDTWLRDLRAQSTAPARATVLRG
jgi:HD-like signal output (HDOD) protein